MKRSSWIVLAMLLTAALIAFRPSCKKQKKNFNPDTMVSNSFTEYLTYVVQVEFEDHIDTLFLKYNHIPSNRDVEKSLDGITYFYSSSDRTENDSIYYGVKNVKTLGIYKEDPQGKYQRK